MATKFDLAEIGSILELLSKNDVREFKLERDSDRLWLRRGAQEPTVAFGGYPPAGGNYPPPQYQQPQPQQYAIPQPAAVAAAPAVVSAPEVVRPSNHKEVKSPMVGTFYRRPAVDASPYVAVGDTVKKGQVLCIVEAMKLMNEIEAEFAGKVVEVCLEDASMVEYGEVLFRIDPA